MYQFVWGNPRFFRYWISSWSSELGDWIRNMTLMFMVLKLSNESAVAVSINMFCEFAPIFLFGSLVGVFADRWNRKRTIIGANLFRAIMVLVFVVATYVESLPLVYIGAFLCSIGTLFFRAPSSAFIMQFVPKEDRKMAASLRQLSMSTLLLVGPAVGTFLYIWLGSEWSLLLNAVLFVVSSILVSSIRVEAESRQESADKKGMRSVLIEMRQGFQYSWQHPIVRPILLACIFFGLGGGLVQVLEIFVITEFLGLPQTMFGTLVSVQGFGMLISSLLISKMKLATDRMISLGMIVMGIGLGSMVLYQSFYVTAAALIFYSAGQIALNIGMATIMQTKIDYEYQGRTGMTVNTVLNGFLVLSLIGSGWLHEMFSVRTLVASGGLIMALGGILCFLMYVRIMKRNEEVSVQG